MKKRVVVIRVIIWSLVGLLFFVPYIAPALAQSKFSSQPKTFPQFTCGPYLLTYEVYTANGQRAKGIRCVKIRPNGSRSDFAWYGEGSWGGGTYRHIGYASNDTELPTIAAADIFGNEEKFSATYPGMFDNSPRNIKLKQIVGEWLTPDEIHFDGAWKEVWKRVNTTSYQPLPQITTCGPHFHEYRVQLPDPNITDRGIRCVSKHGAVWFGSGKWGAKEYMHLGIHEWGQDENGVFFQLGPGEASDICHRGFFCGVTPAQGLQFSQQGSDLKVGGAWNELWVADKSLGISILTINLRGIVDHPCRNGVLWKERFLRIATWMKETGNKPDIIPLQEATGWVWCPTNFETISDYSALDLLLDAIREATGEQYRIAYLVGSKVSGGQNDCGIEGGVLGGCKTYGDLALLYRPSRLRNDLATVFSDSVSHDDERITEPHLRRSLPACNMAPGRSDVIDNIDGISQVDKCNRPTPSGLTWVQRQGGSPDGPFDAAFSRFELIGQPGNFIHLYNLHLSFQRLRVQNVLSLVTALEQRYAITPTTRLYAPFLVGDFNITEGDIGGAFPDFRVGGYTPSPDVIGGLVGKETRLRTHSLR